MIEFASLWNPFAGVTSIPNMPILWLQAKGDDIGFEFVRPRILQQSGLNREQARLWLKYCCDKRSSCHSDSGRITNLKVINCQSKTVVTWSGEDYAALSYVWGPTVRTDTQNSSIED
jgi:hypothetical protein